MMQFVRQLNTLKVPAILSLLLIYIAVWKNWYWLWGILLLGWALGDLYRQQTWLSQTITRQSNPFLFYSIVVTWLVFGFYLVTSPFIYLLR